MNYIEISRFIIFTFISYLIGSIPFAWLAAKTFKKGDIRKKGTGNVGGGNTMLVVGKIVGVVVLILDICKGASAAWLGLYFFNSTLALMIFGIASIIGHCNSIFLKFSGGKGVSTILGVYAVIDFKLFLLIYFIWAALVLITKYSSISTFVMSIIYPFVLAYLGKDFYHVLFSILAAIIITINHRDNIA
ncbi:MAG: glycerol-3-phosphate 1-O-acyltransferase PlsY, partial [Candidatus Omnitrophica bacterium]|nr:glycerol-3-phosphate 1-O-acyltransferase PlsY [Candidatus Omnitrophota bacterium]